MMNYKVILCPPTYFNIEYEINPWMHIENKVTGQTVFDQYEMLKNTYQKLGIPFFEITPSKVLPDQVYITDSGHPEGNIFIKSNYKYSQRKKESEIVTTFVIINDVSEELKKQIESFGFSVHMVPTSEYLKGGGSIKCLSLQIFD